MQVLEKSWPNRQEAGLVCLANRQREGRKGQGRQKKEIKFQNSCRKKGSLTFPFSLSANPFSIWTSGRHALEVLLELKVKGETLLLLGTQRAIEVPTLAVAPWRKFVSFPVFSWEAWPANFYSNSTNRFKGSSTIKRSEVTELSATAVSQAL